MAERGLEISPAGRVDGTVRIPGSKSITARCLIIGALARGESILSNPLVADDPVYLQEAWKGLGVEISPLADGSLRIAGCGGEIPAKEGRHFLGNAGTAMRFLTGALTIGGGRYVLDGDARMRERPIRELAEALVSLGADVSTTSGCPPVAIGPSRLAGGETVIGGGVSSQFLSSILMVSPYALKPVGVEILGEPVSRPYVDLTLSVMEGFGVSVRREPGGYDVRSGEYRGRPFRVEPDASSATYFFAAAAITGGRVRVEGLGRDSIQGDLRFVDVLESMGCTVLRGQHFTEVRGGPLRGVELDARDIPDTVPTISAVGLFADGETRIRNVAHLRFKESDRIRSVATEMRKLGGRVTELEDGLVVRGGNLHGAEVDPWGDHRIAMSAAVVGLGVEGVVIRNPEVVGKSFPGFFEVLRRLCEGGAQA